MRTGAYWITANCQEEATTPFLNVGFILNNRTLWSQIAEQEGHLGT